MTNKSENSYTVHYKTHVELIHIRLRKFSWRKAQMEMAFFSWPMLQMKAHLMRMTAPDCCHQMMQDCLTMYACAATVSQPLQILT